VISFRNPSTVESRIWDKLTEKIEHINNALRQAMADPEDLYQLVLGMTPPKVFRDVFASGGDVPAERFDEWFNRETATFGDADVIDTVKQLVGNCSRFDFQQVSEKLPKVDLPDLIPFMQNMLVLNRRQPRLVDGSLSFKTPEAWMTDIRVLPEYEQMVFDRSKQSGRSLENLLGVGHVLVDQAIEQALDLESSTTALPGSSIEGSVAVFKVFERVTTQSHQKHELIFGIQFREQRPGQMLKDWQLLKYLAEVSAHSLKQMNAELPRCNAISNNQIKAAAEQVLQHALSTDEKFTKPDVSLVALILRSVDK
jgi:hypothetical protein